MSSTHASENKLSVTQYIDWIKLVNKSLHKYKNWLEQFGGLHTQWQQSSQNKQLSEYLHTCQPHFCCMVVGSTAAGKSHLINQLLTSKQTQNTPDTDDIPYLENPAVANQAIANLNPTKNDTAQPPETLIFQCKAGFGGTSIVPVLLMYDAKVPPSFYFLSCESHAQDVSFKELISIRSSLSSRLHSHWKMTLCHTQADVTKAQSLINTTVPISPNMAASYGFNADWLPNTDGYVSIPAWRMVVVNIPDPLLAQSISLLDTPADDSPFYHSADMAVLASSASVIYQLVNATTGVTTGNMQAVQQVQQLANKHCLLPQYVLNHTDQLVAHTPEKLASMTAHIQQLITDKQTATHENTVLNTNALLHDSLATIKENLFGLADARTHAIKQGLIHPLLKQLIKQSQTLAKDISHYEQNIAQETATHDDLHRQKVHLEDDVAKRSENITEIQAIFTQSDMEHIYQHLMSVYSEESFQRYEERAKSMFSSNAEENDDSIIANVENAKNIMLSGLKLDIRRTGSSVSKINNSMRALYADLKDNFQNDELTLTLLPEKITEMENQAITINGTLLATFESSVLMPLRTAFLAQMRTIKKWHDKHKQHLNDPLKFMKNDLAENQNTLKQITHTINQHTNNINEATNMLAMCHQAAADLLKISHQFNDLLNDEPVPVLT